MKNVVAVGDVEVEGGLREEGVGCEMYEVVDNGEEVEGELRVEEVGCEVVGRGALRTGGSEQGKRTRTGRISGMEGRFGDALRKCSHPEAEGR